MTLIQRIQKLKAKKGFTLVELIVVIAILAVLMAILIPTMMNFVENSRIQSANTAAKNFFDTTKQYVSNTEAAARGVLKGTKGNIALHYSIVNSDGKSAEFTITSGTVAYSNATPPVPTVTAASNLNDSIEGTPGTPDERWKNWTDGLKAHLEEQMPNADNGANVLVELKEGAVVQTIYSNSTLAFTGYGTLTTGNNAIFEGKNSDGAIVGSSPAINADTERPAATT